MGGEGEGVRGHGGAAAGQRPGKGGRSWGRGYSIVLHDRGSEAAGGRGKGGLSEGNKGETGRKRLPTGTPTPYKPLRVRSRNPG